MKKMKLITSLVLSLILILSAIPSIVFAEEGPHYGDESLNVEGTVVSVTTTPGIKGKMANDMVYSVSGKRSSSAYVQGTGNLGNTAGIFETAFMLPSNEVAIGSYLSYYKANATGSSNREEYSFLKITVADDITSHVQSSTGNAYWNLTNEAEYDIELNKWYTLAIEFPSNGAKTGNIYLNGVLVHKFGRNVETWGVYSLKLGAMDDNNFYLDNLHGYIKDTDYTFDIAESTPSLVTSVTGGTVENNVITVPFGTKVSELESILTTTDGNDDVKRVYTDSTMATEAVDGALANGTTLVLAAKNGKTDEQAYSYYTVQEAAPVDPDADVLKGNDAGDLSIADNTDYAAGGTDAEIKLEEGVFGKALDDAAYKFEKTNSKAYINYSCSHKADTNSLLEFGFARESAEDSFRLEMNYYTNSDHSSRTSTTMYFRDGGIQWGDSVETLYGQPFDAQKWYTVAVQFPTNGEKDVLVYVNGDLAYTGSIDAGAYGLGYARFKISAGNTFYLDNIRKAQELYVPSKDAKAEISVSNGIVEENILKMLSADEDRIILSENDALRMYKNDWTVAANLEEADFVVVATKNGRTTERTYTYLDKEIVSAIVNYNKVTEEDTTILNSKLMSEEAATLIVAWYTDKELVDLQAVPAELDGDIYTAEKSIEFNSDYSYRIFAWNSINGLYPLTKATDVK